MLKRKQIPTPLISDELQQHRGKILTGEAAQPVKHRLWFIILLLMRVNWHNTMAKRQPNIYTPLRLAQMVRGAMERLGGLWIKAAQIMAMRRDIFPKIFCDELSSLHDRAGGFPSEIAIEIIEENLKCKIDSVFTEFDVVPLAAASIGQVHVARLRSNGRKVAIKVQRPGIVHSFSSDFKIVSGYVRLLMLMNFMLWSRWEEMLYQLQRTLTDELDYRLEVSSMRKMRRALKGDKVYVPKAFLRYCTKRVLVMEFVDGVLMSDYIHAHVDAPKRAKEWRKENHVNPKKVGERLYLSFTMQLLEYNLLHGDLHPGNIMLLKNSRFALIDFGSISMLEAGFLERYRMAIRHLARREFSKYVDVFLTLVPGVPDICIESLRLEIVREFEAWEAITDVKGIPYAERSLAGVNVKLSAIFGKYQLPPMWNLLRVIRSNTAVDASMQYLVPELKYFKLMVKHFDRVRQMKLKQLNSKETRDAVVSGLDDIARIPSTVGENLVFQAELVRKRAMNFQATISKAAKIGSIVVSMFAKIWIIVGVVALANYVGKQYHVGSNTLATLYVEQVWGALSNLPPRAWIVIIVLTFYISKNLLDLRKELGFTGLGKNPFL
jgi:ubiquinone biosynthesis protein